MTTFNYDDIKPLELNEEEPQLCKILYDDEYKEIMGLNLALLKKLEYSERALYMNSLGIRLLASHYTLWCYRYNLIKNLKKDLYQELDWCEEIALDNEKNYQIWNYRQRVIELIPNYDAHREFPLLESMLDLDSKNHHVWSYRKWLVEKFNLHSDPAELAFIEKCIDEDVKNNSAWTHRFFLKFARIHLVDENLLKEEGAYTIDKINISPQNASSWNYIRGMRNKFGIACVDLETLCETYASHDKVLSVEALELKAQLLAQQQKYSEAHDIYRLLASKYDPIRERYWLFLGSRLQTQIQE